MSTYTRQSGKSNDPRNAAADNAQQAQSAQQTQAAKPLSTEKTIKVDGFGQVLAMLEIADDDFRDSLLRRIAQRDPALAQQLHQEISKRR